MFYFIEPSRCHTFFVVQSLSPSGGSTFPVSGVFHSLSQAVDFSNFHGYGILCVGDIWDALSARRKQVPS